MTGRERLLTAIANGKPDRLPCQVHSWMTYYLNRYLGGVDQFAAYERFGMDMVIYQTPDCIFDESDLGTWITRRIDMPERNGTCTWQEVISTPDGELTHTFGSNEFTTWETEHLLKNEHDFELWNRYVPVPAKFDWTLVQQAKQRIGDRGIVRSHFFDFGQCSPWQSFCILYGTEHAIMAAMDKPEWVHHALGCLLKKKLAAIERAGRFELDLVETGGGAGSSTVISPKFHREFCLPYDKLQIKALHEAGVKVVYHLCGGLMPLLEIVAENGADALETMTPPAMGGDCDLAAARQKVGDRLAFIGGFDQNKGFENGNPKLVRKMVFDLFEACPDGGYICCPSDHFFFGSPENIQAFADAARACSY